MIRTGRGHACAHSSLQNAAGDRRKNLRVNFTITNLLNKQPPIVGGTIGTTAYNSGNTFPAFYDPVGRYFTLGATMQF